MRFILIMLFCLHYLYGNVDTNFQNHRVDENKAETYLENLVFDGEFDKAEAFFTKAQKEFPQNSTLWCWGGKLYIEKKDLQTAKNCFLKALEFDPTNDIAKVQLENIDQQLKIKENENIKDLLSFIGDKGFDFLMIFLAFLGGEIIAKRYTLCQNSSIYIMADHFIREKFAKEHSKIQVLWNDYKSQDIFSLCFLINLLVILTIAFVLMIIWLFIVFHYKLNFLIYGEFLTLSEHDIEIYFSIVFAITFLLTIIMRAFIKYKELPDKRVVYEITFVQELDKLVDSGEYTEIYKVMRYLKKYDIHKKELYSILNMYSRKSTYILQYYK